MKSIETKWPSEVFAVLLVMHTLMSYCSPLMGQASANKQTTEQESRLCGAKCLYVALRSIEKAPDRFQLLVNQLGPVPKDGYSLLDLQTAASRNNCYAECKNLDMTHLLEYLKDYRVILHLEQKHFVLCDHGTKDWVAVFDPEHKSFKLSQSELKSVWHGNCLVLGEKKMSDISTTSTGPHVVVGAVGSAVVAGFIGSVFWWRRKSK